MKKMPNLWFIAISSALTCQSLVFADYYSSDPYQMSTSNYPSGYDGQSSYYQNQGYGNDMSEERSYMNKAIKRNNRINQENRNMYRQSQKMIRQAFDPNQRFFRSSSYSKNPSMQPTYQYQEQILRGERLDYPQSNLTGYPQGAYYNQAYQEGLPESYPLDQKDYYRGTYSPSGSTYYQQSYPSYYQTYQQRYPYNQQINPSYYQQTYPTYYQQSYPSDPSYQQNYPSYQHTYPYYNQQAYPGYRTYSYESNPQTQSKNSSYSSGEGLIGERQVGTEPYFYFRDPEDPQDQSKANRSNRAYFERADERRGESSNTESNR